MKAFVRMFLMAMAAAMATAGFGQAAAVAPPTASTTGTATAAASTTATPALWKVKGVHGTVYLFGSIHVMKKDVVWETAAVKNALAASDVLYLEIAGVNQETVQAAQPEIMKLGTDPEHPLSSKITKEDVALLDDAVKGMGIPGEQQLEPMQPWLASLTISVLPIIKAGYDPESGIDKQLEAQSNAAKRPVKGLETLLGQIHSMADMPMDLQVEMLHQTLADLPKDVSETDTLVADWSKGDVEAMGKLENDEMKTKYPELYDRLLVKRNVKFADALEAMLKDPATGTVFVTVGAGHFAGPDSVVKMLAARGFAATRVE